MANSCTSVFLTGMFLFVPSDTCRMYRLATKRTTKNESVFHDHVRALALLNLGRSILLIHSIVY